MERRSAAFPEASVCPICQQPTAEGLCSRLCTYLARLQHEGDAAAAQVLAHPEPMRSEYSGRANAFYEAALWARPLVEAPHRKAGITHGSGCLFDGTSALLAGGCDGADLTTQDLPPLSCGALGAGADEGVPTSVRSAPVPPLREAVPAPPPASLLCTLRPPAPQIAPPLVLAPRHDLPALTSPIPPELHLQTLAVWLREGALVYDPHRQHFTLRGPDGHPIATAALLQDLCEYLSAFQAGRRC